ncbi:hypothetical protein ACTHSQ_00970 [Neisseria sp. P0009.S008]|jgi:hypothetical protein|uniref:hypothetical protein n=1 Tax=unclassified Neisseria TaxID=2623750 RepID=UPI003F81A356
MENQKVNQPSIGKIDRVESIGQFHNATGGKWLNFFQAINPLGMIAEAYARTLAYKIEIKRLEVEELRIIEQAKIAHNVINSTFQLKMAELENRRMELVGVYETVNRELERLHIERKTVLEMAKLAQQASFDPNISIEEKKLHQEMTIQLTKELPNFGNQASISLQNLVQSLPKIEITQKLLEG